MAVTPVTPQDAEAIISALAQRLADLTNDSEGIATWGANVLTEANRTGDEPILIQMVIPDEKGNPVAITWTTAQLERMREMFSIAGDFAAFMRAGGGGSPLARVQKIARPGIAGRNAR